MPNQFIGAGKAKNVSMVLTDTFGNPARVDGTPVWETSEAALLTVTPNADGMGAVIRSTGATGTAQISVRVDADMGDGVREMVGAVALDILAGEVNIIALMVGEDYDPDEGTTPDEPAPTP